MKYMRLLLNLLGYSTLLFSFTVEANHSNARKYYESLCINGDENACKVYQDIIEREMFGNSKEAMERRGMRQFYGGMCEQGNDLACQEYFRTLEKEFSGEFNEDE